MADTAPGGYSAAAAVQRVGAAVAPDKWPGFTLTAPTRPTAACCRYRAGLHGLDLVEHLETERCSVELNREPAVRVIHHFHLLARLATGQRCSGPAAASSGHRAGSGCASPCAPPARPGSRPDTRLASAADAGPWHSPGRGRNACCRR